MGKWLVVLVLAGSACTNDTLDPRETNLSGAWNFTGSFSNSAQAISCTASGSANLTHAIVSLTGVLSQSGSCQGPSGAADISGQLQFTNGQVNGNAVTFRLDVCNYTGTITGTPATRMQGTTSCVFMVQGQNVTFNGNWEARRPT